MILQRRLLEELFTANLTLVRFLSSVSSHVSLEAAGGDEIHLADVAAVSFLVALQVTPQLLCRL